MSKEAEVYKAARAAFEAYAGMDAPNLPEGSLRRLQVQMTRWRSRHFGTKDSMAAGVSEELGEMAAAFLGLAASSGKFSHVFNKSILGIRGYDDPEKGRQDIADAMADMIIFATQLCTDWRLDFETLVEMTGQEVLKRDWTANKTTAHMPARRSDVHGPNCGLNCEHTLGSEPKASTPAAARASQSDEALIQQMVRRFLQWRLPDNFAPDGGISFKAHYNVGTKFMGKNEPIGTNLLDAVQAEAMVRHLLGVDPRLEVSPPPAVKCNYKDSDREMADDCDRDAVRGELRCWQHNGRMSDQPKAHIKPVTCALAAQGKWNHVEPCESVCAETWLDAGTKATFSCVLPAAPKHDHHLSFAGWLSIQRAM